MKRLVLLVVALGALAVAVPAAETAPTSDSGCTVEHLSNAECQGPDMRPPADICEISTWVGNASCDLTVADGVADTAIGFLKVFATLQEDNNWQTEFGLVIRDKVTGAVLFERTGGTTTPLAEAHEPPEQTLGFSGPLVAQGGGEVTCEITGTHTAAGAAFSAQAVVEGFGAFNNTLRCQVR